MFCQVVRSHYGRVQGALKSLDDTLLTLPFQPNLSEPVPAKDPKAPTAVIIVRDFDGISVHTLLNIQRLFPNHFKNIVFISVGVIDIGQFKGHQEIEIYAGKSRKISKLRRVRQLPGLVRRVAL